MESIDSIQDLLELLKGKRTDHLVFRGETEKFPSISSSGFRNKSKEQEEGKNDFGKIATLNSYIDEYYRQIGYKLDVIERNNFITYAQHHSMPTNLIDVSSSISTALYFATSEKDNAKEKGYLYGFDTTKMIKLLPENLNSKNIESIYDILIIEDYSQHLPLIENIYYELKRILTHFKYDDTSERLSDITRNIFEVISSIKYEKDSDTRNLKFISKKILQNLYDIDFTIERDTFSWFSSIIIKELKENKSNKIINGLYKRYDNLKSVLNLEMNYVVDTLTLWIFILFEFSISQFCFGRVDKLVKVPHMLYYPDMLFDRMHSQKGLFIYQNYFETISMQKESSETIYPDIIIEIKNKSNILNQLDLLGINQRELFPDADNIAEYIKRKI